MDNPLNQGQDFPGPVPEPPQEVPQDLTPTEPFAGMPAVIIPKKFVLSEQDPEDLNKLKSEVMDKVNAWESRLTTFFGEYDEFVDSWRVVSRKQNNKPKGLFNSRSGETHRATETLATLWFRMLLASDPPFEAVADGLDEWGRQPDEEELYVVEALMTKQQQRMKFKEKMLRGLRGLALFGTQIFEAPFTQFPYGYGEKVFEATDLIPRSLLTTGYNPFVFDMDTSDYIFTIDFPTIWMLKNWSSLDPEHWDQSMIEKVFTQNGKTNDKSNAGDKTITYNRVLQRKLRAGYSLIDTSVWELIGYHGRVDTSNNSVIGRYWDSTGRTDDPNFCDMSITVLNGEGVCKFNPTPFKTWHHRFKTCHYKLFEMEPQGYGVGKIGRRRQKEIDSTESRSNDLLMFALLSMWKVGKNAGLDVGKLTIKPWSIMEMDDIEQLEPIRPQIEALAHAMQMQQQWKEDFRTTTGATTNLQAQATGATATEASITQNEAMRGGGVIAEVIGDSFYRDYLDTCYVNNLFFMDNGVWVKSTGSQKPYFVNKDNLPVNVGFKTKITTDKDFRPDRLQKILEALQMATSIRNLIPNALNVVEPLFSEWFRGLGLNPRLLKQPVPIADQLIDSVRRAQRVQDPQMKMEMAAEQQSAGAGSGANVTKTPVGPVNTSPLVNNQVQLSR